MATKTLTVELPEDLYIRFTETVTEGGGPWRSRRNYETATWTIEGAVTAALMLFLQDLTEVELEFRDYMHEKYPELDEDLITMMADLIEREREKKDSRAPDKRAEEIGEVEKEPPQPFHLRKGYQI